MKFRDSQLCLRFLMSLLLVLFGATTTRPQEQTSQTPDVQQMQKKLEQLEQELHELKQQISAAQQLPKQAVVGPSVPVETDTRQAEEHSEQPKASTSVDFYGYAMLDSGYNFGSINPDWFDVMRPTQLPSFADQYGPNGSIFAGVRQTRFGVKTFTPTEFGDLKTIFEFELFGTGVDAGQTTFRLRHAWGEFRQIGAGQTWSPFMDPDVFPNSLEYWGPTGMVFFRTIQARWTPWQKGDSNFMIAAERPGASADQGQYSGRVELEGVTPQFTLPDISAHFRYAGEQGHAQLAGIFRKISWVDLNATPELNIHGTAYGWGINASGNYKFDKADVARLQLVYGHGIENYMNDAPVDVGVKNNFGNPTNPVTGEPLPVLGIVAFDDHNWSDRFSSTVGYSYENISNTPQELGSSFHQGDYALANLLYYPTKNVMMGGEFQFGRRVNFADGWNYNDYRVQFSFKYNYSKSVGYAVK
jgi:DcaP outer membrane protein